MLLFSCWVISDSLWPHGLQYPRPPCLSLSSRVCPRSCPLNWWCCPIISSSTTRSSPALSLFQYDGQSQWVGFWYLVAKVAPSASVLSMNILGLISFSIDWFDLLAVQGTLKSLLQHHSLSTSILRHSAFFMYGPTLTSIHDYWKDHSFDSTDLCWQSDVSAF